MAPATPLFRHIHFSKRIPYPLAQSIQAHFVSQQLSYKATISSRSPPADRPPAPLPTILTFESLPVYTLGRRESLAALSGKTIKLLQSPLPAFSNNFHPQVLETQRGGQTTFHGPGQVVIYPILDIKAPTLSHPKGLDVRGYVGVLEKVTIHTLGRYGVTGVRTENPGVWTTDGERKIAALGVQLRRFVSSYGVALNVKTDLKWFDRIVACGLEGKKVTNMHSELATPPNVREKWRVAQSWVEAFAEILWGLKISRGEVMRNYRHRRQVGLQNLGMDVSLQQKIEMSQTSDENQYIPQIFEYDASHAEIEESRNKPVVSFSVS